VCNFTNARDRKRLEDLRSPPDVIARTEEVLRLWGVEDLFATCSYCGKPCYNPDLPKRQYRRKKLPADLFLKQDLLGFRDSSGEVICWPCDELEFQ
jgi:hypothetical protein